MKTPDEIFDLLTGADRIHDLADILREKDPSFIPIEQKYIQAVSLLRSKVSDSEVPSVDEYISAFDATVSANMLYAAYLGYRANLSNFQSSYTLDFTKMDFTDFIRDHLMGHFPMFLHFEKTINVFRDNLSSDLKQLIEPIQEYYIFLDSYGPKFAHYAGYMVSNKLLPWVEPGYREDPRQTIHYQSEIKRYLGFLPF